VKAIDFGSALPFDPHQLPLKVSVLEGTPWCVHRHPPTCALVHAEEWHACVLHVCKRVFILLCDSCRYLAPEACKGSFWPASDVWAVGVLTAQLLTGNLPFTDRQSPAMPSVQRVLW
jgi:calcium-dependent protein kinase